MNPRRKQHSFTAIRTSKGLTLVELIIAMVLGLFLTAGIINLFIESKRNFSAEDEMARMQENGRYALNILKRELTLAGFFGGIVDAGDIAQPGSPLASDCEAGWATDATYSVDLINNADADTTDTVLGVDISSCITGVLDDTDVVTIKRTAGDYTVKDGEDNIAGVDHDAGYFVRIKDYGNQKEFYLKSDSGSGDYKTGDYNSGSKADYWEYYAKVFYIRDSDGVPTLFVNSLNAGGMTSSQAVVEGIENFQIEFGIDTNGDYVPDMYTDSPSQTNLASIVTARIYLLVRSVNTIPGFTDSGRSYVLGSTTVNAANDGFYRKVFTTTVQMRNAILPNV